MVPPSQSERVQRALRIALWLNVALSGSLMVAGVVADSSGLIANALDNTSDAAVYAMSYYATTHGSRWKIRAAHVSGVTLLLLCAAVLADVVRRFLTGTEPVSGVIVVMAIVAAIVNIACLRLLHNAQGNDVSLRAAWTFSINDLLSNLGILVAGILVAWLGRAWPDLVVGLAVALFAAKGGIEILIDVRRTNRRARFG